MWFFLLPCFTKSVHSLSSWPVLGPSFADLPTHLGGGWAQRTQDLLLNHVGVNTNNWVLEFLLIYASVPYTNNYHLQIAFAALNLCLKSKQELRRLRLHLTWELSFEIGVQGPNVPRPFPYPAYPDTMHPWGKVGDFPATIILRENKLTESRFSYESRCITPGSLEPTVKTLFSKTYASFLNFQKKKTQHRWRQVCPSADHMLWPKPSPSINHHVWRILP